MDDIEAVVIKLREITNKLKEYLTHKNDYLDNPEEIMAWLDKIQDDLGRLSTLIMIEVEKEKRNATE